MIDDKDIEDHAQSITEQPWWPAYEAGLFNDPRPYNEYFGDYRICACSHVYVRHFDTYDNMFPVGCKYCECEEWHV